ncbi:MAG TPA: hypothetical protein VFL96_05730, partial [Acidobacteriaceae bacterium]|nr:hypothetical protein [Acidobacteriaceae bacterium]
LPATPMTSRMRTGCWCIVTGTHLSYQWRTYLPMAVALSECRPYKHRVRSMVDDSLYPFPLNRDPLNRLYGPNPDEAAYGGVTARFDRLTQT